MFTSAGADWKLIPSFIVGMNDLCRQLQDIHDSVEDDEAKNSKLTAILAM